MSDTIRSIALVVAVTIGCAEDAAPAATEAGPSSTVTSSTIGSSSVAISTSERATDGDRARGESDGVISGEIVLTVHEFSIDYSDGVPFGPGAHAVVEIWRAPWNVQDVRAELAERVRIDDVDGFPISFEIPIPDELGRRDEYGQPVHDFLPRATVHLGEADGTTYVGDLVKEVWMTIEDEDELLVIPVAGLERCGSDRSGGNCAVEDRPD